MKAIRLLGRGSSLQKVPIDETETWGIKFTWNVCRVDKAFILDDWKWLIERRGGEDVIKKFNDAKIPIVSCQKHPKILLSEVYPLEEVRKSFGFDYYVDNPSYMIALAICRGFQRIELFGIDLDEKPADVGDIKIERYEPWENERACLSFWLGVAKGMKIEIMLPEESTLLKPVPKSETNLYGYKFGPKLLELRRKILAKE